MVTLPSLSMATLVGLLPALSLALRPLIVAPSVPFTVASLGITAVSSSPDASRSNTSPILPVNVTLPSILTNPSSPRVNVLPSVSMVYSVPLPLKLLSPISAMAAVILLSDLPLPSVNLMLPFASVVTSVVVPTAMITSLPSLLLTVAAALGLTILLSSSKMKTPSPTY